MNKRAHKLIVVSMLIHFSLCSADASSEVKQDTKGNQSPAVYISSGGSSNITYNNSDKLIDRTASEIQQKYVDCLDLAIIFQTKKLKYLNKTLAELYAQETTDQREARKWAQDLIDKAPEIKNQKHIIEERRDKYNREFSKNLLANVYKLFTYIFQTVDSRLLAFQELNTEVKYKKNKNFIFFNDESTQINRYVARTVILPNGNRIQIICDTGKIHQGIVSTCPTLIFAEVSGRKTIQSFKLVPHYGGHTLKILGPGVKLPEKKRVLTDIKYIATGEEMLTMQIRERFNSTFQDFFKLAYTR